MKRLVLFWLSLAFLAGILVADWVPLTAGSKIWAAAALMLLAFTHLIFLRFLPGYGRFQRFLPASLLFLFAAFALGMLRYYQETRLPTPADLAYYADNGPLTLEGVVCQDPQQKQRSTTLIVCADFLEKGALAREIAGRVIVRSRPGEWLYGDRLRLHGSPMLAPEGEDFSYRLYLSQRRIDALLEYPYIQKLASGDGNIFLAAIYGLRQRAYVLINAYLPQPEAGFLSGVLLGIENDIPEAVERAFQVTGTAHLVAISGYNMALLAGLVLKGLRRRFSLLWTGLLAAAIISIYTILVGAAPAVIRAALMSSLAMTAHLIGRKQAGPFTLTLTVAILCAFNPLFLWDAGFQLSVAATFGLVMYADRISAWFMQKTANRLAPQVLARIQKPVSEYLLFTLAAQVTVLPVILYHFKSLSLSTLLANPLVLPVQPLVMMLGGLAVLIGLIFFPLGQWLAYLAWVPLAYTLRVVSLVATFQATNFPIGRISLLFILIFYALLLLFTLRPLQPAWFTAWQKPGLRILALLAVTVLLWQVVFTRPDGFLHIIAIGQPDQRVHLLLSPSGKRVLIGSTVQVNTLSDRMGRFLPLFDRHLDLIVLDPMAGSQLEGVPRILERFPTRQVAWMAGDGYCRTATSINERLLAQQEAVSELPAGTRLLIEPDIILEQLPAEAGNVFLLQYHDLRLLIPSNLAACCESGIPLGGVITLPGLETARADDSLFQIVPVDERNDLLELVSDGWKIWSSGR